MLSPYQPQSLLYGIQYQCGSASKSFTGLLAHFPAYSAVNHFFILPEIADELNFYI